MLAFGFATGTTIDAAAQRAVQRGSKWSEATQIRIFTSSATQETTHTLVQLTGTRLLAAPETNSPELKTTPSATRLLLHLCRLLPPAPLPFQPHVSPRRPQQLPQWMKK